MYIIWDGLTCPRYPQSSGDPVAIWTKDFYTRSLKSKATVDEVNTQLYSTGDLAL